MKKNKPMKVAGYLLVATLLSTSMVSGTFAKYVTQDTVEDTARVAKFGVTVTAEGGLFAKTYKDVTGGNTPPTSSDTTATLTVKSSNDDNVIAPGTKNDTGVTFSVSGTPEVAVKVTFSIEGTDVWLGTGTYQDMTNSNNSTFTFNDNAYYPIEYTLTYPDPDNSSSKKTVSAKGLTALQTELAKISLKYDAGTDLSKTGSYQLTWKWDFGSSGVPSGNDKKDTLLGNLATGTLTGNNLPTKYTSGGTVGATGTYNLNADVNLTITVEQVD